MQATNDNSVCRCILALTQGFQPAFRICEVQPLPESQLQMLRRLEQNPSPAQALCFPRTGLGTSFLLVAHGLGQPTKKTYAKIIERASTRDTNKLTVA